MTKLTESPGWVYLIHLAEPLKGSQHYVGWTVNPDGRLYFHRKGKGAKFLKAAAEAGIYFDIIRMWEGDKKLERQIKNCHNHKVLCPYCNKELLHRRISYREVTARRRSQWRKLQHCTYPFTISKAFKS